MFTGIIVEVGTVVQVENYGSTAQIRIHAPAILQDAQLGDSIAVNGTCLTVASIDGQTFTADISAETWNRTYFSDLFEGAKVNLEPSLHPTDKLGGHIVTGHVDGVGTIESIDEEGDFWKLGVRFPDSLARYIAVKGSLCVDGISLTVADIENDTAYFAIVPFTLRHTNLDKKKPGDFVNLEVDLIARYIERLLMDSGSIRQSGLTVEKLRQYGFIKELR